MKSIPFLSLTASCLLAAGSVFAQLPAKSLTQLLKSSFTAPKSFAGLSVLSSRQLQTLRNRFDAIEEVRRALYQDPGWVVSKNFAATANYLKELGMPLPQRPAADAPLKDKELYRQQVNHLLQQEGKTLGQLIGQKPRPSLSVQRLNWDKLKVAQSQLLSNQPGRILLQANSPTFSWGTPNWDEVRVKPVEISSRTEDAYYMPEKVLLQLTDLPTKTLGATYDYLMQEKSLSPLQKQTFISLIAEASSLLTYHFVQSYMYIFGEIPSVSYDAGALSQPKHTLQAYAAAVQDRLLHKLQNNGTWTEEDFEWFVGASVFLPADQARAILAAATYLEPKAALWLLKHPLQDKTSQEILAQLNWARLHQQEIWPNGNLTRKHAVTASIHQAQRQRILQLQAYQLVLINRLEKLLQVHHQLYYMKKLSQSHLSKDSSTRENLADTISLSFIEARQARLERLIGEIQYTLHQVESELKSY